MAVSAAQRQRCLRIKDKAKELFGRSDVGDCESLAELVEWTQDEFHDVYFGLNNDEETFVEDLGLVLTERTEWGSSTRDDDTDLYLGFKFAKDRCFSAEYQDGSNQVRHFWGYVMIGFNWGPNIASVAARIMEGSYSPNPDVDLSDEAGKLGSRLDQVGVSLDEVATWIRDRLCKDDCFSGDSGIGEDEDDEGWLEEDEEGEEEEGED